jgi:hypothetical protein
MAATNSNNKRTNGHFGLLTTTPLSTRREKNRRITAAEETIDNMQQTIAALVNKYQVPESDDLVVNLRAGIEKLGAMVLVESAEEKERKRSLVIIGLPEPQHSKASDRVKADADSVSSMLDALNVETAPVAVYRMGRAPLPGIIDNSRKGPRLIKVVLPSSQHQHRTLGALRSGREALRKLPGCGRVLIRPSLTAEEREKERELQDRLRKKRAENPGCFVVIRNGEIVVDAAKKYVNKNFQ